MNFGTMGTNQTRTGKLGSVPAGGDGRSPVFQSRCLRAMLFQTRSQLMAGSGLGSWVTLIFVPKPRCRNTQTCSDRNKLTYQTTFSLELVGMSAFTHSSSSLPHLSSRPRLRTCSHVPCTPKLLTEVSRSLGCTQNVDPLEPATQACYSLNP